LDRVVMGFPFAIKKMRRTAGAVADPPDGGIGVIGTGGPLGRRARLEEHEQGACQPPGYFGR